MNSTEIQILSNSNLSHISRSVYMLYLRPQAFNGQINIDFYELSMYLQTNSNLDNFTISSSFIENILQELERADLIEKTNSSDSYQGSKIRLKLLDDESQSLPQLPFKMYKDWSPSTNFASTAISCGLKDYKYKQSELSNFVNYWAGRNEHRNQNAWERAFIQRLIKKQNIDHLNKTQNNFHSDSIELKDDTVLFK